MESERRLIRKDAYGNSNTRDENRREAESAVTRKRGNTRFAARKFATRHSGAEFAGADRLYCTDGLVSFEPVFLDEENDGGNGSRFRRWGTRTRTWWRCFVGAG